MRSLLLFSVVLLFTVPAYSQWTGPDAANNIYYTKGFVGVGDVPLYRFHLKSTDLKPLLFAETADATFSFSRHVLDLRAKSSFARTPYIAWYAPNGLRQAYMGWEVGVFNLTLENGFTYSINGGNVGIGTYDTKGYLLAVAGKAVAEEIVVKLKTNWPDYVFQPDYRLPPLEEVSQYIQINKRLPGIPSAETVSKDGISVNDMTTSLLQKIEELTLYLIHERENVKDMETRLASLEQLVNADTQSKR
jgi:hypothetical protein